MKKIFFIYLIPLCFALAFLHLFNKKFNEFFFKAEPVSKADSALRYIDNFQNNQFYEDKFLLSNDSSETIVILGSSELNGSTEAIPYNFISDNFKTKVVGVGHAGNQCFSIYSQLLANENRLKNAPIVIILSPGWFESKSTKGTSSAIFLEYNSEWFLKTINKNSIDNEFTAYENKRISQLYNEFNAPNLELKLMNYKHLASKSFIHAILFYPVILFDNLLISYKEKIVTQRKQITVTDRKPIISEEISINWDSLLTASKVEITQNSNNNRFGINNQYYNDNIRGKRGKVEPVRVCFNQELEDFKMLLKLLKNKKANVSFVMSPLNPIYCKNLDDLSPTINVITDDIKQNGYCCLNLFETDTLKYDKAVLFDIMHMSKYGWYKINKFIVETYKLTK
jgi:D-alanyl-lipoteichoic acid biosynthesis protein DltD